jgi:hypothetical protein
MPLQRYLDDPEVEELWVKERLTDVISAAAPVDVARENLTWTAVWDAASDVEHRAVHGSAVCATTTPSRQRSWSDCRPSRGCG